jgi:hypothetical protein
MIFGPERRIVAHIKSKPPALRAAADMPMIGLSAVL